MPWRARYIESRRHPQALSSYAMGAVIGLFFLTGLFESAATASVTTSGWQLAWEWEVFAGGIVGFAGAAWPTSKHLDDALNAEALGALLSGFGFATWALTAAVQSQWASPAAVVFGIVALGFLVRCWQASRDRRRWLRLTAQIAQESKDSA